ncbi:Response regulator receiver domain-containing protein [Belnapia rosea]|nr:Response regulator receiver domain-containing protein [Belnapia rosea]
MAVLLVEDDTMVRLTPADIFDAAGLDFLEADNAEDAMAIIGDPSKRVDILVADLDLGPGDSGLTLAGKARQRRPRLQVVYETGSPEMLAGHAFSPWERLFCMPFDPVALATMVSALDGTCRPGRRRQRPACSKTVASSL